MPTAFDPALLLAPHRAGVVADGATVLDVLVRVQAPDQRPGPARARHALNLALVLDRSGSMDGRPLEEAKRCAELVVASLTPRDRVAVVTYDSAAQVLVPSQPVVDPWAIRGALRRIVSGGSTALHAGWQSGIESARPHARPGVLSRVLLLSDGQANAGLTDPGAIAAECGAAAAAGVGTSTYGLGHSFNEDLMTRMAQLGEGQAWYGETADDLHEPFAAELALLDALFARRVVLRVEPAPGVEVGLRNAYASVAPRAWRLPNLALGAESWAMLTLRVGPDWRAPAPLLHVAVAFEDLDGRRYELAVPPLILPALPIAAWQALAEDELVARRAAELAAADLQRRARAAVRDGDWRQAEALLAEARAWGAGNPWVADVVAALEHLAARRDEALFLKEAAFASHRMDTRLAAKMEALAASRDEELWLQRKRQQGRTER